MMMKITTNYELSKIYYSLEKNPTSFSNVKVLYKHAKRQNPHITKNYVQGWLIKQPTYSLHRQVRINFKTQPVLVYEIDEQWQADLVDLSKLSKKNSGYKFILVIIDILSKYVWLRPLKSKKGSELKEAIEDVLEKSGRKPRILQSDKGTEYRNSLVQSLLQKRNIKFITTHSERKASVVECVNRTLKAIMFRYFTYKNTRRYVDVLQDLQCWT